MGLPVWFGHRHCQVRHTDPCAVGGRAHENAAPRRAVVIEGPVGYLSVELPVGAILALQVVVRLGHIGNAAGRRVIIELLAGAVGHQAEKHLLHHRTGIIEVAMRLRAGAVNDVGALALLPNGDLVAGGGFNTAGGVPASRIARWDGTTWSPFGSGLPGSVSSLTVTPAGELVASDCDGA